MKYQYNYDMEEEDRLNRTMCGAGHVWNPTLGRCLRVGGRAEAKERAQNAVSTPEIVE